jgi:hypothetical protein
MQDHFRICFETLSFYTVLKEYASPISQIFQTRASFDPPEAACSPFAVRLLL